MVFSCFYNAPVSYYASLVHSIEDIRIELSDNYTKQTYRNRCKILGANGIINLVIPVVKAHGKKTQMKDVQIDYDTQWNKTHWKSIFSAYASAPFYEYFEDTFRPFYTNKYKFLADLNMEMVNITLESLECNANISITDSYQKYDLSKDFRELIHPKKTFSHSVCNFTPTNYHQVFSDKFDFVSDLSIIDLLFNEGPNSRIILKNSISGI